MTSMISARTPADRDRYVDLLRVASIGVVVLGHWLMAVPSVSSSGVVSAGNVLGSAPWLQYLTWALQVMPVFFLVGGFADFTSLSRGLPYADFVRARLGRLLAPTSVFVVLWAGFALLTEALGVQRGALALAAGTVAQPLWFLGVYLLVVGLAPVFLRLHRRWTWRVPVVLGVLVAVVDAVRFLGGVPAVGLLNLALVWLAVHQFGYLYADGLLASRRASWGLAAGGLAGVVVLTSTGWYPVSMVGLPGAPVSNMSPPTLALLAHAVWLTGAVLLLRPAVSRLLMRPRAWAAVVGANLVVMTVFLWHLTVLFLVYAVLLPVWTPVAASGLWWATRPVWLVGLAAVLTPVVAVLRRYEQVGRPVRRGGPGWPAAVGMTCCALGILALSAVGFGGMLAGHLAVLAGIPVNAPVAVGLVAVGAALGLAGPGAGADRPAARTEERALLQ